MATTRTAAASVFLAILFVVFSAPQVWAQTDSTAAALEQMARSLADMADSQKREAEQSQQLMDILLPAMREAVAARQTRTANAPSVPATATADCNYNDPNLQSVCEIAVQGRSRANAAHGRLDTIEPRVTKAEQAIVTLKGRITPRPSATAPAAPATRQPAAAPAVSMTTPAAERLLAVKFVGSDPNLTDVAKVRDLISGGRYELAGPVIWLPVPGVNDQEKAVRSAARDRALDVAYGTNLNGRQPADSEESAQLVAGAPAGTGAVFHLRLKPAKVAATPATP